MRMLATAVVVCFLGASIPSPASAGGGSAEIDALKAGGPVGLGMSAGTTIGASLKVWPVREHALVFHLGVPPILNSVGLHLSYRFHFPAMAAPSGPAFFFQLGPAFRGRFVFTEDGAFPELGGGVVLGLSVTVPRWPVELCTEVQPTFGGSPSNPPAGLGLSIEGVVGVRFYFAKRVKHAS